MCLLSGDKKIGRYYSLKISLLSSCISETYVNKKNLFKSKTLTHYAKTPLINMFLSVVFLLFLTALLPDPKPFTVDLIAI